MSTRRARIKVAPNLSLSRSKNRTDIQVCKDHVNDKIRVNQPAVNPGLKRETRGSLFIKATSANRPSQLSPLKPRSSPTLNPRKLSSPTPPSPTTSLTSALTPPTPTQPSPTPSPRTEPDISQSSPTQPPPTEATPSQSPPVQATLSQPTRSISPPVQPIPSLSPPAQPTVTQTSPTHPPPTQPTPSPSLSSPTQQPSSQSLSNQPSEDLSEPSSNPSPLDQTKTGKDDAKISTGTFVNGKYISKEKEGTDKTAPSLTKPTMRKFLGLRNKFKPNLSTRSKPVVEEVCRRTRNSSTGDSTEINLGARTRKMSAGENNNELASVRTRKVSFSDRDEVYIEPRPAPVPSPTRKRIHSTSGSASSGDESRGQTTVENGHDILSPVQKPRTRRISESRQPLDKFNLGLKRRKVESKRRFSQGVPGRHKMTMFDLIYYNPDNGTEMVVEEPEPTETITRKLDLNESVDNPEPEPEDGEDDSLPVPQVKVGINGEIILDESTTLLETTANKRAKEDLSSIPLVVENSSKFTNYGTWSKKRRYSDWSEKETFRFYRALSIVGSDFSMMESMFKKRTRQELKLKFKKEEKVNGPLVDKCLKQMGQYIDIEEFMGEDTEEDEKVDRPTRGRKRKGRITSRKRHSTRGHYDSSSGGEEADISEASRSPATRTRDGKNKTKTKKKSKVEAKINKPSAVTPPTAAVAQPIVATATEPAMTTLEKLPGVRFPPALLAANPGLAGAKPGSLVVVASPSKSDPRAQMLHVYMVSDKKKKDTPPVTPRNNSPLRSTDPGRLSIDPAVVRAVDRKRTSVDRTNRTPDISPASTYRRQRTLSEGTMISPSRLRTLSATIREDSPSDMASSTYTRTRISSGDPALSGPGQFIDLDISGANPSSSGSNAPVSGSNSAPVSSSESSVPTSTSEVPIARKSKPS